MRFPRTVAGPRSPSHEVGCSTEYFERRGCKRIGFLAPTMTSLFPGSLRGSTSTPAPVPLRVRVHPLLSSTSPSEYCRSEPAPHANARRLPWGFLPHRDISGESPLVSELPRSRSSVRPQRFSRSRRLAPLSALRVCFTPQPRSGFTFQGLHPATEPDHLVDGPFPLAVVQLTSAGEFPLRRRPQPPRLQGLHPGSNPRSPSECLALPTPRSPPRFQLPRDFLRIPWERLRVPSAHDLDRQTLRVNLAAGLQRIDQHPTWHSVPRLPSRSSFPACLRAPAEAKCAE